MMKIREWAWAGGAAALVFAMFFDAVQRGSAEGVSDPLLRATLLSAAAGLIWFLRGRYEQQRARRVMDEVVRENSACPRDISGQDDLSTLHSMFRRVSAALADREKKVVEHEAYRERVENELRVSEERQALALSGADEGLWEWDLKTDRVYFSERWCRLLGLTDRQNDIRIDTWYERIHPKDLARVQSDLALHLAGHSSRFESEHRIRHEDGTYRWMLARAATIRHANGQPHRLVGLAADVSARKQIQQALMDLADGLGDLHGEACLQALARSFAKTLGVREVFICECMNFPTTQVRMVVRWRNESFDSCVAFDLAGTACSEVIASGKLLYEPINVGKRWPLELDYDRRSYLGVPCTNSQGVVIGHIACADPGEMPLQLPHEAILKIFAVRASIELERQILERTRQRDLEGHTNQVSGVY